MTILAYDRSGSVRSFDDNGRLRVERTPISKANICTYQGREIPHYDKLGLHPDQPYRLLRDPHELAKAADSFNSLPILEEHIPTSAQAHPRELTVGATMDNALFEAPYLTVGMVIFDGPAIARIQSGEQKELSCGYAYEADMTPGTYGGQPYDGRMINIRGNHIALVTKGRAGPDVLVHDSSPAPASPSHNRTHTTMTKTDAHSPAIESDIPNTPPHNEAETIKTHQPTDLPAENQAEDKEAALNAAIQKAIAADRALRLATEEACRLVRPLVGDVHGMDSAEDVYRYALQHSGMAADSLTEVNQAGLRALVHARLTTMAPPAYNAAHTPLAADKASASYSAPRRY
ncbi:DUF2213 domain-containing protein [Bombella saccharophila]|uniref:DUF2213 domain-containing protein n=1 Tax=Bombella saccharophila TaxID=2967338 RepID=A0ABT3W5K7_9PROT|nr:DUF2213 domain-containing protein [Bombella saccharophila]MCX5613650.1 DUF2213 domain-containing protein [Bombella saccharophila]